MKNTLMYFITTILLAWVGPSQTLFAQQDSVGFLISSAEVEPGEQFDVEVRLENFIKIGVLAFDLNWIPYKFEYVTNSGFLIETDGTLSQVVEIAASRGLIRILWLTDSVFTGHTEPDETIFFKLTFRATGSCGESSFLSIDEESVIVDNVDNITLPYRVQKGQLKVLSDGFDIKVGVCPSDSSDSGSCQLTMCGDAPPYTINYIGPGQGNVDTIVEQNDGVLISHLVAGTYDFYISNSQGDSLYKQIIIPSRSLHQIESIISPPTCHYSADGNISINIMPVSTYQIVWSTGEYVRKNIFNLANGAYTVEVTDTGGCSVTNTMIVQRDTLAVDFELKTDTIGADSSALVAHVRGGVKPYIFHWESFPPSLDSVLDDVDPLIYRLTVTDSFGCFLSDSIDLTILGSSSIDHAQIDFILSPNPTSSFLTVERRLATSWNEGELVIVDGLGRIRGRQLLNDSETSVTLDVRALEATNYWLTFWQGGRLMGSSTFIKD